jgi:prevent-host-death family protein
MQKARSNAGLFVCAFRTRRILASAFDFSYFSYSYQERLMAEISATDAKNKFGQVLEMVQSEPVRIQKNGRDVAVVLSAEQYAALTAGAPKVRPAVEALMARSIERRRSLYEALAR